MSKINHYIALMIDATDVAWNISWKAGNMLLNRFCIDEDAAFESAGVYFLKDYINSEGQECLK